MPIQTRFRSIRSQTHSRRRVQPETPRRRGIATIWLVAFGPAFLSLLVLTSEIASLWLARIELETAVESGALAAVTVWCSDSDTAAVRTKAEMAAKSFAQANTILGNTFTLGASPVTFGSLSGGVFNNGAASPIVLAQRACLVHASVNVESLWGFSGPHPIQASATAG